VACPRTRIQGEGAPRQSCDAGSTMGENRPTMEAEMHSTRVSCRRHDLRGEQQVRHALRRRLSVLGFL
jgi:hypothetical protein